MNDIQNKINSFKKIVVKNFDNENFIYREWFAKDHLLIVERIAMELCDKYPEANRNLVLALVWFHDFGKPFDEKNEYEITKTKGVEALQLIGFDEDFIGQVLEFWEKIEKKEEIDLSREAIEIKIVSSADGASHFVGKFYPTYFLDDSNETIASIEKRIKEKIVKDWERKIVIPELKKTFKKRYLWALEIVSEYPEKFIV